MDETTASPRRGTVRKLARQATIFALLGFLIASICLFVKLEWSIKTNAKQDAAKAVHADLTDPSQIQGLPSGAIVVPIGTVEVPLTNGTILHVRKCADNEKLEQRRDVFTQVAEEADDCKYFSDPYSKYGGHLISVPLGHADQVAIEKDYWAAYKASDRKDLLSNAAGSLLLGLIFGFPGGIGLWVFYRLVYFALKG